MYTYLIISNNEIHQILLEVCHGIGWNVVAITGMRMVVLGVPAILEVIEVLPSFKAGFDFQIVYPFFIASRTGLIYNSPDGHPCFSASRIYSSRWNALICGRRLELPVFGL